MFPPAAAYVFASFWPLRLLPGAFLRPGSLQTHKRKSSRPLNSYSIWYCKFVCCSLFAFLLYVLSNIEKGKATSTELKNFRFIRELYSVKGCTCCSWIACFLCWPEQQKLSLRQPELQENLHLHCWILLEQVFPAHQNKAKVQVFSIFTMPSLLNI